DDDCHCPPPLDHRRHGPAGGARKGPHRRGRHPRRTPRYRRPLRPALGTPVRRLPRFGRQGGGVDTRPLHRLHGAGAGGATPQRFRPAPEHSALWDCTPPSPPANEPMKLLEPIHRLFETWVDPFSRTGDLKPPALALKFFWFYVSQAKLPFL